MIPLRSRLLAHVLPSPLPWRNHQLRRLALLHRKAIFNRGMIPNIPANPRGRETPKRGRKPIFDADLQERFRTIERVFAWENKFRRLLLRFERISSLHYALKSLAYTDDQSAAFLLELKVSSSILSEVSLRKSQICHALETGRLRKPARKTSNQRVLPR